MSLYHFCSKISLRPLTFPSRSPPKDFTWRGTWRSTYLSQPSTAEPVVDCSCLFSDVLHRPFYCAHVDLTPYTTKIPSANRIARLPDLTYTEFAESWVTKPFILTEPVKQWPIYRTWDLDFLREKYSDVAFRAEAVDWPLRTYLEYMSACDGDESPLYLFDRAFAEKMQLTVGDNSSSSSATDPTPDYTPPTCFGPDAFTHLGSSRPDHRWLIIGPARSGSTFHQDPNATSAWNAVLRGKKYWILFPPSSSSAQRPPPPGVYVSEDRSEVTSPLSIAEWFLEFHAAARATPGCVEGICEAGEVVYVPSGWFHLVLNLEESIAVTQNLVPRKRVGAVLRFLKEQRQSVSGFREEIEDPFGLWVERLREADPELAEEGLAEMERLGRIGGRWEELTKGAKKGDGEEEEEGEGGGFSFGFGFGGDEGEEEQA